MAVYFTSSVPHGNTEEISTDRIAQYDTRISKGEGTEGQTEHVVYVPNLGEFTSTDIEELEKVFGQISGTIGIEKWKMTRPEWDRNSAGNSGTH